MALGSTGGGGGALTLWGARGGVFGAGSIEGGIGGGDFPVSRGTLLGGLDWRGAGGKGGAFIRRGAAARTVPVTVGSSTPGTVASAAPEATLA